MPRRSRGRPRARRRRSRCRGSARHQSLARSRCDAIRGREQDATVDLRHRRHRMEIESVASVAVIAPDAALSRKLYVDALGLPLKQLDGDYFATEEISGCRHFGVWPLHQAAQACFGTSAWPDGLTVPQMSVEF